MPFEKDGEQLSSIWAQLADSFDGTDRWYLEAIGLAADKRWDECFYKWNPEAKMNTPAGREIIWRSRSQRSTPEYLRKLIARGGVSVDQTKKLMRAFDFQVDSQSKKDILFSLAISDSENVATGEYEYSRALMIAEASMRVHGQRKQGFKALYAKDAVVSQGADTLKLLEGTPHYAKLIHHLELTQFYPKLLEAAVKDPDSTSAAASVRAIVDTGEVQGIHERLNGSDIDVAVKTARLLGDAGSIDSADMLRDTMLDENRKLAVRMECVRSLVRIGKAGMLMDLAEHGTFPKELQSSAAGALAGSLNVNLRARVGKLFPMPPTKDNRPIPQMTDLLVFDGDVDRGRKVFADATCVKCHKAEGQGVEFGPDLSTIGAKLPKRGLYEAILNPSSGIATSYEAYQIITDSGQTHSGLIVSESDTTLSLKIPGGTVLQIPVDNIEEKAKLSISAMPSGLVQLMTLDDLIDLVEYLATLKS